MNDEFTTLKEMVPACRGHDGMHKLAILQGGIEYMAYLERCLAVLRGMVEQGGPRDRMEDEGAVWGDQDRTQGKGEENEGEKEEKQGGQAKGGYTSEQYRENAGDISPFALTPGSATLPVQGQFHDHGHEFNDLRDCSPPHIAPLDEFDCLRKDQRQQQEAPINSRHHPHGLSHPISHSHLLSPVPVPSGNDTSNKNKNNDNTPDAADHFASTTLLMLNADFRGSRAALGIDPYQSQNQSQSQQRKPSPPPARAGLRVKDLLCM